MPDPNRAELPAPDAEALAHSQALSARIAAEIEQSGPIGFQRFMEMALYEPGLGYYVAGSQKFGAEGDFVTAPELSPLFAQCLAEQCRQVLQQTGGGAVLEAGAGSGAMASGILRTLAELDCLPERYLILELSPELRERQRQRIGQDAPGLLDRVEWLERWPREFRGVALANELLDALPVRRFQWSTEGVQEIGVDWRDGPVEVLLPADSGLNQWAGGLARDFGADWAPGYRSEFSPLLKPWVMGLARNVSHGAMLLVDYGYPRSEYYLGERRDGTLICHYRHRVHADPYFLPGLQDITAFVDFTAVAEAAAAAGMDLEGFTTQAAFLLGNNLLGRLQALLDGAGELERVQLTQATQKLTLPGEMGEKFRVIGFSRGLKTPLTGFAQRDLSRQL